jgi:hypothetical protein
LVDEVLLTEPEETSVSLLMAELLIAAYKDGVWSMDLRCPTLPLLFQRTLASALGLQIHPEHSIPGAIRIPGD